MLEHGHGQLAHLETGEQLAGALVRAEQSVDSILGKTMTARPGMSIDEADVIAFCKERLAAYKLPREIRVVDALPKNATGKLLKRELRTWSVTGG